MPAFFAEPAPFHPDVFSDRLHDDAEVIANLLLQAVFLFVRDDYAQGLPTLGKRARVRLDELPHSGGRRLASQKEFAMELVRHVSASGSQPWYAGTRR
ncbi:hypothetical protein D3C87_1767740 [compost metagenome]